jgi:hypothetical protein
MLVDKNFTQQSNCILTKESSASNSIYTPGLNQPSLFIFQQDAFQVNDVFAV